MEKSVELPSGYTYIGAFLTMRCNLGCSYCLNNIEKNREFNRKIFKEIPGREWVESLNKINSKPEVPVTFTGGEPFLHRDFTYIINNLKPETNIDILTNLQWGKKGLDKFIAEVNPERVKRNSPYASIRVSYHPEQMGNGEQLVKDVLRMQEAGFNIGVWSVLYPSPETLSAINQMQFRCKDQGIDFRLKEFTGVYKGQIYGDLSKYENSAFQEKTSNVECKTSELLIGTNGNVYRCHRDLFNEEFPIGNLRDENFMMEDRFRECDKYGQCHPCDVKVKTNYKQQRGYTSVEIRRGE